MEPGDRPHGDRRRPGRRGADGSTAPRPHDLTRALPDDWSVLYAELPPAVLGGVVLSLGVRTPVERARQHSTEPRGNGVGHKPAGGSGRRRRRRRPPDDRRDLRRAARTRLDRAGQRGPRPGRRPLQPGGQTGRRLRLEFHPSQRRCRARRAALGACGRGRGLVAGRPGAATRLDHRVSRDRPARTAPAGTAVDPDHGRIPRSCGRVGLHGADGAGAGTARAGHPVRPGGRRRLVRPGGTGRAGGGGRLRRGPGRHRGGAGARTGRTARPRTAPRGTRGTCRTPGPRPRPYDLRVRSARVDPGLRGLARGGPRRRVARGRRTRHGGDRDRPEHPNSPHSSGVSRP